MGALNFCATALANYIDEDHLIDMSSFLVNVTKNFDSSLLSIVDASHIIHEIYDKLLSRESKARLNGIKALCNLSSPPPHDFKKSEFAASIVKYDLSSQERALGQET